MILLMMTFVKVSIEFNFLENFQLRISSVFTIFKYFVSVLIN